MNSINLYDLIKIYDNVNLSKKYLKYYLNYRSNKEYRHNEVMCIKSLIETLGLTYEEASGFYYSYEIPRLNKEMDLLKITKKCVINIELKSSKINNEKIMNQLRGNEYYLKLIHKPMFQFTYVMSLNKFYTIKNNKLITVSKNVIKNLLSKNIKDINIDLDDIYKPCNIFASPIYMTNKFLAQEYLLNDSERFVKKQVLNSFLQSKGINISGGSGTGKTMVLYDIARTINRNVIVINPLNLIEGHLKLNECLKNVNTINAIDFKSFKGYDVCFIDEAHHLSNEEIELILSEQKKFNIPIYIFYDYKQSIKNNNLNDLLDINEKNLKLTKIIRTNKETYGFINAIFQLKSVYKSDNYKVVYSPKELLKKDIERYISNGYTYITYDENDNYYLENENKIYTKKSFGREYEKVLMVLDDKFYYVENNLKSIKDNEGILYTSMLFQGLTRARDNIILLVTKRELLENIMKSISK